VRFTHEGWLLNEAKHGPKMPKLYAEKGCDVEADLHRQILEECRRRGWIALHGSMAHSTFRNPGEWDFDVKADGGRSFLIEAKTRTGKLSPDQRAIHAWAAKLGHQVHVVRSFEAFLAVIDTRYNHSDSRPDP
jgi:hypothetical protein